MQNTEAQNTTKQYAHPSPSHVCTSVLPKYLLPMNQLRTKAIGLFSWRNKDRYILRNPNIIILIELASVTAPCIF